MGIYETIQELETLRKKTRKLEIIGVSLFMGLIVFFVLGTQFESTVGIINFCMPLFMVCIVFIIVTAFKGSKYSTEFTKKYKEVFLVELLNEQLEDVYYQPEMGFTEERVEKFGLVRHGNRFRSEDYLQASYKGVTFEQSDVSIRHETGSGKNRHTETYFRGRMFSFEFPKNDFGVIQVRSENFYHASMPLELKKMDKIEMENVQFNKMFDVKAVNSHDAFYILTPQMMERILKIREEFSSINMNFVAGKLYLAGNSSRDAFNPKMNVPIDYNTEKNRMAADIQVIKDVIDTLQLEQ